MEDNNKYSDRNNSTAIMNIIIGNIGNMTYRNAADAGAWWQSI